MDPAQRAKMARTQRKRSRLMQRLKTAGYDSKDYRWAPLEELRKMVKALKPKPSRAERIVAKALTNGNGNGHRPELCVTLTLRAADANSLLRLAHSNALLYSRVTSALSKGNTVVN